jgi:hypothetical protein
MSSIKSIHEITNGSQHIDALYLAEENRRRKEAILRTDTEKFYLFTRMMRINNTLSKAKIIHKKAD